MSQPWFSRWTGITATVAFGDLRLDVGRIGGERLVDLAEDRHGARGDDRVDRRDEGEARDDHLVAAADAERSKPGAQSRRPARDADRVAAHGAARGGRPRTPRPSSAAATRSSGRGRATRRPRSTASRSSSPNRTRPRPIGSRDVRDRGPTVDRERFSRRHVRHESTTSRLVLRMLTLVKWVRFCAELDKGEHHSGFDDGATPLRGRRRCCGRGTDARREDRGPARRARSSRGRPSPTATSGRAPSSSTPGRGSAASSSGAGRPPEAEALLADAVRRATPRPDDDHGRRLRDER